MAVVQAVGHANGNGTGTSFATTIAAVTAGSAIVVAIQLDGGGTCSSVTDSAAQTYTPIVSNNLSETLYTFVYPNSAAGVTSVTATVSSNAHGTMQVIEESGIVAVSPIDQSLGNNVTGTSWTTGNMSATTNANDVLYSFICHGGTANGYGPSGSWVALTGTGISSGVTQNLTNGEEMYGQRQVVAVTGAYAGTGVAAASVTNMAVVFALKQGANTISVLQETGSTAGSGASVGLAFSSNQTAGSSNHVIVRAQTATAFTCTDSQGNTYKQRGPVLNDGGAGHSLVHFTCDGVSSGANTVTIGMTPGGTFVNIAIREIGFTSGFDTHMEQVQVAYGSSATDGITSGVMAPSTQPGLVSAFCNITVNTPPVLSVGTGYTQDQQPWGAGSSMTSHKRYTTPIANQAATFTNSTGTSTNAFTFAAMFKETGAATPTVLIGASSPTSGGTSTALATSKFSTRNSVADTAAFSGFVTSLNIYVNSLASAVVIYLGLYDTSNNLLCGGQVNLSLGLNTIGIANGPFLTAAQAYWMGAESDGSPVPADDSASNQRNQINNTTFPLPTGLIFPGSTVTGGRMSMWAGGIAGVTPTSPLYHRRNVLYFIN